MNLTMATLQDIEASVKAGGTLTRNHLLAFLELINTSDSNQISAQVKAWLTKLHEDPTYTTVVFPQGDIDRVLEDLASYGRLQPNTILEAADGQ